MGPHVASQLIKAMVKRSISRCGRTECSYWASPSKKTVPICAIPGLWISYGNSRISAWRSTVSDPWVIPAEAKREYGIDLVAAPEAGTDHAVILAVAHDEFKAMGAQGVHAFGKPQHVVYDLKYILPRADSAYPALMIAA